MAKIYITEYTETAKEWAGRVPIAAALEPCVTDQTPITLSGSSQQSAAFNGATRFIMLSSDGIFSYAVGVNPTATVDQKRVPAGQIIYVGVQPGHKIAVITQT